jgi:hypothetical protein
MLLWVSAPRGRLFIPEESPQALPASLVLGRSLYLSSASPSYLYLPYNGVKMMIFVIFKVYPMSKAISPTTDNPRESLS